MFNLSILLGSLQSGLTPQNAGPPDYQIQSLLVGIKVLVSCHIRQFLIRGYKGSHFSAQIVSSERRNPILANVMAQLDYMEKRGSGLTRICNETKASDGYRDELKPKFKSTPTQFQTTIFASSDTPNVGDNVGDETH